VSEPRCNIKFGIWNAHSVNKKSGSICDLVISKHLDILAITETWLTAADCTDNQTIAEILNTLRDYEFYNVPRLNRTGGGVGVLLRKGFTVEIKYSPLFASMELLYLQISCGSSSIRLVTVYRPLYIVTVFFDEFSTLLETHILAPGYLLLNGDFNFHMNVESDMLANSFKDLLESAGLI
jgi:exonuclease III